MVETLEVTLRAGEHAVRINGQPPRDHPVQPQRPFLVTAQPAPRERPDVGAAYPPVRANGHEGQVPSRAQVNDVLARAAQQPCGLAGGQQILE